MVDVDLLRRIAHDLAELEAVLVDAAPSGLLDPDGAIDRTLDVIVQRAEGLRERIGTLDALQSPRSGKTYGTADDLFDAMGLPFKAA